MGCSQSPEIEMTKGMTAMLVYRTKEANEESIVKDATPSSRTILPLDYPLHVQSISKSRNQSCIGKCDSEDRQLEMAQRNFFPRKGEFCAAFYHTPMSRHADTKYHCLDENGCDIGTRKRSFGNNYSHPRKVFGVVKLEVHQPSKKKHRTKKGKVYGQACIRKVIPHMNMYSNCERRALHAEYFFVTDARSFGQPGSLGAEILKLNPNHPTKLVLYLTYQPCHHSSNNTPEKSCTEELIKLYQEVLKPRGIVFVVKVAFIYKALNRNSTPDSFAKRILAESARLGIHLLFKEGIMLCGMEKEDWIFLLSLSAENVKRSVPPYELSNRRTMDEYVNRSLTDLLFQHKTCLRVLQEVGLEDSALHQGNWLLLFSSENENIARAYLWGLKTELVHHILAEIGLQITLMRYQDWQCVFNCMGIANVRTYIWKLKLIYNKIASQALLLVS